MEGAVCSHSIRCVGQRCTPIAHAQGASTVSVHPHMRTMMSHDIVSVVQALHEAYLWS